MRPSSPDHGPRSALVIGGGSGIGCSIALRLSRTHAVIVADVRLDAATSTARDLTRDSTWPVVATGADVRRAGDVEDAFALARSRGPLDVVVNTAGLSPTMANGHEIIEVNAGGAQRVVEHALEAVEPGGVVVLLASIAGHMFRDALSPMADTIRGGVVADMIDALDRLNITDPAVHARYAYAISKLAVLMIAEDAAVRFGRRGIRVVSISPGMIDDTPMGAQERARQPRMDSMIAASALARYGEANDIAAAAEFLWSPAAAYITGTDLRVDGGTTPAVIQGARMAGITLEP